MKKEQREVYRALVAEIDTVTCVFCRYAESQGCRDGVICRHPLEVVEEVEEDVYCTGKDCWAFRPIIGISDIADIVGLVLSEDFRDWSWVRGRDGGLRVMGEKPRQESPVATV